MSVRVLAQAFAHSRAGLGSRLTIFALADAAHDDGVTWISEEQLAHRTRLTERQVRNCLRNLEELGEVETRKAQRGRRRINVYHVVLPGLAAVEYDRLPFDLPEPFTTGKDVRSSGADDRKSATVTTGNLRPETPSRTLPLRPEPLVEPSDPPVVPPQPPGAGNRPVTVDRRTVKDDEYGNAVEILDEFNRLAGTRYASRDYVAKIIMRLREHPSLTVADHARVIAHALADPWWKGQPSPSVVYGNASLFERAVHSAAAGTTGRGLTPDEIATFGIDWGPGTDHTSLADARAAPADLELDPADIREEDDG